MTLRILAAAFFTVFLLSPANLGARTAQNDSPSHSQASAHSTQTLTGCLFRGEAVDEFKFDATNGLIWHAVGQTKRMKMDPYVGHRVTLRGKLKPDPDDSKLHHNTDALRRDLAKDNAGILTISRVLRVGAPCKQ